MKRKILYQLFKRLSKATITYDTSNSFVFLIDKGERFGYQGIIKKKKLQNIKKEA